MSRPVLFSWIFETSSAVGAASFSASRSAACPPIMPLVPIASTTVSRTRTFAAANRSPLGMGREDAEAVRQQRIPGEDRGGLAE